MRGSARYYVTLVAVSKAHNGLNMLQSAKSYPDIHKLQPRILYD